MDWKVLPWTAGPVAPSPSSPAHASEIWSWRFSSQEAKGFQRNDLHGLTLQTCQLAALLEVTHQVARVEEHTLSLYSLRFIWGGLQIKLTEGRLAREYRFNCVHMPWRHREMWLKEIRIWGVNSILMGDQEEQTSSSGKTHDLFEGGWRALVEKQIIFGKRNRTLWEHRGDEMCTNVWVLYPHLISEKGRLTWLWGRKVWHLGSFWSPCM